MTVSTPPPTPAEARLDRRVRRTRRQLCEAILALLVERDYEEITVQEITERADLNRATFYLHFNHKDELLAAALEAHFDELVASFGDYKTESSPWGDITPEILTFRHVAEHAALYKVLLSDRGMGQVIYRIINYIARFSQTKMITSNPNCVKSGVPQAIIAHHIAGTLFSLLSWWVANNMPYTPEEMAAMAHHLSCNGIDVPIKPPIGEAIPNKAQKRA